MVSDSMNESHAITEYSTFRLH
jgi:hypothetical protein